jgi:AAA ATPase domain
MRLKEVCIDGFRSVKEKIRLLVDPRVTILIGANDHGKTNLLETIRTLNDGRPLIPEDENWDSIGQGKPIIEYEFQLDAEELIWLKDHFAKKAEAAGAAAVREATAALVAAGKTGTGENAELSDSDIDSAVSSLAEKLDVGVVPIPETIKFIRAGVGGKLNAVLGRHLEGDAPAIEYFRERLPRVELFSAVQQYMDVVTLVQLEEPEQEFMQGIFRYAGIWDERKRLFRQDPATARRLERASEEFTRRIREEWRQGENLTFRFQHAGQSGNQIELLIRDPAVTERFVRPSERSAGFSAFFATNMRLLARTEANPANEYIFLFDEPGTALHPSGQVNLQRVFERLSQRDQIIYATHSLFMVNHNRPERNRVVSKDTGGTKVDQKPYLRNWRAVRDALGLILAGNFFIADTTLLVEGESDAMYTGALLAAFDRADIIDIDLNLFSVQWAGNSRDFEPMARLMLEEGRHVVAMMDGDRSGTELRKKIEKLNIAIQAGRVMARGPVELVQLEKNQSIEDLIPSREKYLDAVVGAALELVASGALQAADGISFQPADLRAAASGAQGNLTLGRHLANVTRVWFKENEPISKLTIAHRYCAWLEDAKLRNENVEELPEVLRRLIAALKLESKLSKETVLSEAVE